MEFSWFFIAKSGRCNICLNFLPVWEIGATKFSRIGCPYKIRARQNLFELAVRMKDGKEKISSNWLPVRETVAKKFAGIGCLYKIRAQQNLFNWLHEWKTGKAKFGWNGCSYERCMRQNLLELAACTRNRC